MSPIERAKDILKNNSFTCVVCKEDKTFTSTDRGVKPLVVWYRDRVDMINGAAADKVVGRGAAFMYLLLEIRELYAYVISKPALGLLTEKGVSVSYGRLVDNMIPFPCLLIMLSEKGVSVSYGTLVDNIINRQGNGICPFEDAVINITDPNEAYDAIIQKMKKMNIR